MEHSPLVQRLLDSIAEHDGGQAWNQWRQENPTAELDFSGVKMNRFDLRGFDLSGANFAGADLRRASFKGATLVKANLNRAELSRADLREADLTEATLHSTDLRQAYLNQAILCEADVFQATFEMTVMEGADLTGIRNFTIGQTCRCNSIVRVKGLTVEFLLQIQKERPHLMEWWSGINFQPDAFEV